MPSSSEKVASYSPASKSFSMAGTSPTLAICMMSFSAFGASPPMFPISTSLFNVGATALVLLAGWFGATEAAAAPPPGVVDLSIEVGGQAWRDCVVVGSEGRGDYRRSGRWCMRREDGGRYLFGRRKLFGSILASHCSLRLMVQATTVVKKKKKKIQGQGSRRWE